MAVSYTIDVKRRLISSSALGDVTAAEILDHQNRLMRDPDFDPTFRQLADFTGTTRVSISSTDVRILATRNFFAQGSRRCVVAPTAEIFGLARMFQTFRELNGGKEELQIFNNREEALSWLLSDSDNETR
jgi:hypothetical protein